MDPTNNANLPGLRASFRERAGWGWSEVMFLMVLVLALAAVVLCGRFAYREGRLLEGAKANGQMVSRWAEAVAAAHAKDEPVSPLACGPRPAGGAVGGESSPASWQDCREALVADGGPLAPLRNPFNTAHAVLGKKCERKSALTRGHVVVEKGTPPPPGIDGAMTWGPLDDKDLITQGLALRVRVCDAGGYAIRVNEVTL